MLDSDLETTWGLVLQVMLLKVKKKQLYYKTRIMLRPHGLRVKISSFPGIYHTLLLFLYSEIKVYKHFKA